MFDSEDLDEREGIGDPIKNVLSKKYVHYKRVGEIIAAFSKFGFGRIRDSASMISDLKLDAEERKDAAQMRSSIRLRLLLENLGPTFIKLGQMLSTRADMIPEEYAKELGNLRDDVPAFSFEEVKEIVRDELGRDISEVFESFSETPIAAASIGQVHAAVLKKTGEKVAVKVQRPGIQKTVHADIEILKDMADILKRTFRSIENFDPKGVIEEFGHMIKREIDYTLEARNIERFRKNLSSEKNVTVPKVFWEHSTKRVLTMDFIEGVSLDEREKLDAMKVDYKTVTDTLGKAYIKQIFLDGFFHADPHHDNIFVLKGNRVCFLDFGAIGYMDDETKDMMSTFYIALIQQDVGRASRALVEMSGGSEMDVDLQKLQWDLRDFIDYNFLRKENVPVAKGMNQRMATIAIRHNVMLPASFFLLERALAQIEGVCRELNPKFDIVEIAQQNIVPLLKDRFKLRPDPVQALETAREYRKFAQKLPKRADKILRKLENDEFVVKVDPDVVKEIKTYVRKVGLIVAVSLICSALIVYIGWSGQVIDISFLPITFTVLTIFVIWLILVFAIYRKL